METPPILLIGEVASRLRVSIPTINRWLHMTRKGQGAFPLPISAKGCKGRWLSTDIEAFLQSLSTSDNATFNVCDSSQQKRESKTFGQRQESARQALERHAVSRKSK